MSSSYHALELYRLLEVLAQKAARLEAENQLLRQNCSALPEDTTDQHMAIRDRQRIEDFLRESEERFRNTFEQAAVGIGHVSPTGEFLRLNQRFADITGYPLEQLQALTFQDITHPDDLATDLEQVQKLLAGEIQTYAMEKRYVRKDRKIVWINLTVSLVRDRTGEPSYFISVIEDITPRKQAEETLRDSEERLRLALTAANQGLYDLNLQTGEVTVSPEYATMLGYDPAKFHETNDRWKARLHPDDREHTAQVYQDYLAGKIPEYKVEFRQLTASGDWKWVLSLGRIVEWDATGKPLRMLGTHTDIDDRIRAEQELQQLNQDLEARVEQRTVALRESEERWQLALRGSNASIWDRDFKTNSIFRSHRWKSLRGFTEDEVGYGVEEWSNNIHPEDHDRVMAALADHLDQKTEFYQQEYRVRCKDGSYIWLLDRGQALWDEDGNLVRMVGSETDISARKQAEAELLAITSLQQAILDGTDYLIVSATPDGLIQTFNAAAQAMLGYTPKEVIHQISPELLHDPEEMRQKAAALSAKLGRPIPPTFELFAVTSSLGIAHEEEWTYVRKDGSRFPVLLSVTALRNSEQQIIGYLGIAKDITQQKQAEVQLRKSEAHLAAAQRIAHLGSWEFDLQTGEVSWSEEIFRIYGRDPNAGEPTFEEIQQAMHPDDRDRHAQTVQQAIVTQQPYELEYRLYRPDGTLRHLQARGEPVFDADDQLVRLVGTALDITDRKQTEEELRDLSDRLKLALQAGAIGSWDWDLLHEASWDDRMYELYGFQRLDRSATYQDWVNTLHPDDRAKAETALQNALRGNQDFDTEYRIIRPDGALRFIKASALVQRNQQGEPQRMVGINYDITDRKQVEEQLRQTNEQLANANLELAHATRLKDEFLANMSHELRTPLNAILGMSEGLQEGVFGAINDRQAKAIATIERSGRHLLELINDILDLSKIESGKLDLQISNVPVRSLCDGSIAFVKQMALKKNIQINTCIPATLGSIQVDDRRLRQVLINLLSNAVKFTPEGGSVTLDVRVQSAAGLPEGKNQSSQTLTDCPDQICFSVTDTGIGIASADLDKLFQPFVQIDSSLSRQYAGTGLGLALVEQIVRLHGGTVAVTSSVGQGSCFTVCLPYHSHQTYSHSRERKEERKAQSFSLSSRQMLMGHDAHVLIIEDSTAAAEQIARYLHEMGMKTIIYPRGEGAIQEVQRIQPALVILDIQLPSLSGWTVLTQLKANPQTQEIPVLIVSVVDERSQALALGASGYLVKPINRTELRASLEKLNSPMLSASTATPVDVAVDAEPPLLLLAEDNQANIDTMSGYLESRGYRLILAQNGQEAVAFAKAQSPDLILMDIQMPEMDGLEAIRQIRCDRQFARIPIIALTALAMPGDRERCLAAGANEYLTKPIKLKQLVAVVKQLLEK